MDPDSRTASYQDDVSFYIHHSIPKQLDPDSRTASYQDDVSFYIHHSTPKHLDPDSRTASHYHAFRIQDDVSVD